MKKFRNWVTFAVVLAMVLSLAVGVSATSSSSMSPHYGTISGTSYQSSSSPALLYTYTKVSKNPDRAYFEISVDYRDGFKSLTTDYSDSGTGVLNYTRNFAIYFTFDAIPNMAYVSHSMQGGTEHPSVGCYTSAELTIN